MFWNIRKLEKKLLSQSTSDDIVVADSPDAVSGLQTLNPEQIKKEVSVLSRILINGYCGWPFHSKLLKLSVLLKLNKLFDINAPMSADNFFWTIGEIIKQIPDRHLKIGFTDKYVAHKKRKFINVGENIATGMDYKIEKSGDFAIIAAPAFGVKKEFVINPETFMNEAKQVISNSAAVIIDLLGNPGGNSRPGDRLAQYLYGSDTPSSIRTWCRGTQEGIALSSIHHGDISSNGTDPWTLVDNSEKTYPEFSGIEKPIYILTDSLTGSGAEMFCTKMSNHPFAKRVGDNTKGCEVYGNQSRCILPNTGIIVYVGTDYRELEAGNIELKGYAPNIRVRDGMNALDTARADFYNHNKSLARMQGRAR